MLLMQGGPERQPTARVLLPWRDRLRKGFCVGYPPYQYALDWSDGRDRRAWIRDRRSRRVETPGSRLPVV